MFHTLGLAVWRGASDLGSEGLQLRHPLLGAGHEIRAQKVFGEPTREAVNTRESLLNESLQTARGMSFTKPSSRKP